MNSVFDRSWSLSRGDLNPEYPDNTPVDYSNSSREVESEESADISHMYDMGLSQDTTAGLNHVTGVERSSSYDPVKQNTTLQDELLQSLSNHRLSSKDVAIARAVIGSLDERGYLTAKVDDLHELLATRINVQQSTTDCV